MTLFNLIFDRSAKKERLSFEGILDILLLSAQASDEGSSLYILLNKTTRLFHLETVEIAKVQS